VLKICTDLKALFSSYFMLVLRSCITEIKTMMERKSNCDR